ncbi:MAG: NADH-quinone oxidoreductase subunit NuoK [Pyrinomonadaceae bacterium]
MNPIFAGDAMRELLMRELLVPEAFFFALQSPANNLWNQIIHSGSAPDLSKFLVVGALLFVIGVAGVLTRRNVIVIFMSIELMLNAANLNFIAFSRYLQDTGNLNAVAGQVFTIFVIVVAAAEAAIGLGIVIALYRNRATIFVDEIDLLKW